MDASSIAGGISHLLRGQFPITSYVVTGHDERVIV